MKLSIISILRDQRSNAPSCGAYGVYSSLLALDSAINHAQVRKQGCSFDILLVLCGTNSRTERLVRNNPLAHKATTIQHCANDISAYSHGISQASGDYVCIVNGEHISENFLVSALEILENNPQCIVVPQYIVNVGENSYWRQVPDFGKNTYSSRVLLYMNPFPRTYVAPRALLQRALLPWLSREAFFPDWQFFCDAVAENVPLHCAKHTAIFVWETEDHILIKEEDGVPIPLPNKLFACIAASANIEDGKTSLATALSAHGRYFFMHCAISLKNTLKRCFPRVFQICRTAWKSIIPLLHQQSVSYRKNSTGTECVRNSQYEIIMNLCQNAGKIDPAFYPVNLPAMSELMLSRYPLAEEAYVSLWRQVGAHKTDIVYMIPWLKIGGADLMAVNYANTMAAAGFSVVIMTTEVEISPWKNRLSKEILLVEFGELLFGIPPPLQEIIVCRVLLQLSPQALHITNSWIGFRTVLRFSCTLQRYMKIFASFYGFDYSDNGHEIGGLIYLMRRMWPLLDKMVTDNAVLPKQWFKRFGLEQEKLHVQYGVAPFPNASEAVTPLTRTKVLWAGRLDKEKRPDILLALCKSLPDICFVVYGRSVLSEQSRVISNLKNSPNVDFRGAFESFAELPAKECFAFVYTSQYDGLPNILLEATVVGLPIVAPLIGGISDFLSDNTGWPISSSDNIEQYVQCIREIQANPLEANLRWKNAYDLLRARHSQEKFQRNLLKCYKLVPSSN